MEGMNMEVKCMETFKERSNVSARSWTRRAERKHAVEAGFYPELRTWVQRAILEAEKRGNFEKKDQLLSLLKEL
jgi:uncharacterized Ntn-hydrolase superfamily protein